MLSKKLAKLVKERAWFEQNAKPGEFARFERLAAKKPKRFSYYTAGGN